jgi:hypothetical protein
MPLKSYWLFVPIEIRPFCGGLEETVLVVNFAERNVERDILCGISELRWTDEP